MKYLLPTTIPPLAPRRSLAFFFAIFCLLSWPGCGSGGGSGCSDDYDCPESQICVGQTDDTGALAGGGQCETFVCKKDEDCVEPGVVCDLNACVVDSSANK